MSRRLLQMMQMPMLMKRVVAQARPHAEAGRAAVHVGNLIREDPMAPPLFRLPSTQEDDRNYMSKCCIAVSCCIFGNSDRPRTPFGKTRGVPAVIGVLGTIKLPYPTVIWQKKANSNACHKKGGHTSKMCKVQDVDDICPIKAEVSGCGGRRLRSPETAEIALLC